MARYAVIIEKAGNNYSAYCPDVPGCVAAADTVEETIALMADALKAHFELMKEY
jgi:predicted RNase H-like HicB family nuclease